MRKSPVLFILYFLSCLGLAATGSYFYFSTPEKTRQAKSQETLGFVKVQGQDVRVRGVGNPVPDAERDLAVSTNEQVSIGSDQNAENEVHGFKVKLLSPTPAAILWNNGEPIEFLWEKPDGSSSEFEVSTDPQFVTGITRFSTPGRSKSVKLEPNGVYFWRIVTPHSQENSPISSFSVYALKGPIIEKSLSFETDANGSQAEQNPVELTWADPSLSDSYQVEISTSHDFSHPLMKQVTTQSAFKMAPLSSGDYFWHVISRHVGREELISRTAELSFKTPVRAPTFTATELISRSPAAAPTPIAVEEQKSGPVSTENQVASGTPSPTPNPTPSAAPAVARKNPPALQPPIIYPGPSQFELYEDGLGKSSSAGDYVRTVFPKFEFSLDPDAETSVLQWSEQSDFEKSRFIQLSRDQSKVEMHHAPEKDYYVRVKSTRGNESVVSRTVLVKTLLSPPVIQKTQAKLADAGAWKIIVQVKTHTRTKKNRVELCDNADFQTVTVVESTAETVTVPALSPGEKYLRVQSLGSDGKPVSEYSEVVTIVIEPQPALHLAPTTPKPSSLLGNSLELETGYTYSSLDITDKTSFATGQLALTRDLKIGARATQRWTDSFGSFEEFSVRVVGFEPSANSEKTLADTDHVLPHTALGLENKLGSKVTLRYSLGMENNLALHGLDAQVISIDSIAEPVANLQAIARIWKMNDLEIFGQLSGSYLLGAATNGYTLSPGTSVNGGALLREKLGSSVGQYLEFSVLYQERRQDTSLFGITEQGVGVGIKYVFSLTGSRP